MTVTPAERGPQVSGTAAAFLVLSSVAVLLRCYCRIVVVRNFGLDDWSALAAWIFFILYSTFCITGVYHGTGQHTSNIPLNELPIGLKWWWACEPAYVISNMALKFSIGVMLLRIAASRTHKIIIWTVIAVMEVYSIFFFFLFVFQCRPSRFFWTRYAGATEGSCINTNITVNATYVYSAISCWVDWTLAIVPVFIVWDLQMNVRTKISVAMILGLGAIASTATIVRIPYIKGLADVQDFLYATTDIAIWSTAETGMGLAASSFATLRPLFRNFFLRTRLMGGTSSNTRPSPWPTANGMAGGYIRSRSKAGAEEFRLRSDVGSKSGTGVTTVIESDRDPERDPERGMRKGASVDIKRKGSSGHMGKGTWNASDSVLVDESSDDGDMSWSKGIRKTTVQTQTAN